MIIPEWLFKEERTAIKNKNKKVYNPKTLNPVARENFNLNDKGIDKELAEMMINPYYFTVESLKIGFRIFPESHIFIHANSILINIPIFADIGMETRYI